jgi:hypothetical protein
MTGDHHGQTAGRATLLARAMDEILGTHSLKHLLATPAGRQSLKLLPHDVVDALVRWPRTFTGLVKPL